MIGSPAVEWQIGGQDRESIAMAGDLAAELDALKVRLYQAVLETDGWASVASMLRDPSVLPVPYLTGDKPPPQERQA
jgi:hypothetical protein